MLVLGTVLPQLLYLLVLAALTLAHLAILAHTLAQQVATANALLLTLADVLHPAAGRVRAVLAGSDKARTERLKENFDFILLLSSSLFAPSISALYIFEGFDGHSRVALEVAVGCFLKRLIAVVDGRSPIDAGISKRLMFVFPGFMELLAQLEG